MSITNRKEDKYSKGKIILNSMLISLKEDRKISILKSPATCGFEFIYFYYELTKIFSNTK